MARTAAAVALLLFVAALPAAVASSPTVEIPFTFTDGFIRIEARLPQSEEPVHLLLDSGAGASVLSLRTAQRLHLPLGRTETVHGVGVDVDAYHLRGVCATAEGATLASIPLAVDLSSADALCSEPVDGLIGVDFFRNRVVQIDYTHHRIRLFAPAPVRATERLPMKVFNGMICVPVGVNDSTPRWTRFDTGCNDALHWVIPRATPPGEHEAVSIGFITDESDTALTTVLLGRQQLRPIKTALHSRPIFPGEAGLLGNGVLSQFTVTVDWPSRQVLLENAPR
jgi:hypothetical protein